MSTVRAIMLTLCSAVLAVVGFGGLYSGLAAAPPASPRPALIGPARLIAAGVSPGVPAAAAPREAEQYLYCRPERPPLALGRYDAVFALGAGLASERADLGEVLVDGARLRPLAAWLAVARFGAARTLGFAGGRSAGPSAPSEAASMRRFVETAAFRAQYGRLARAQPGRVVLEEASTTTDSNVAQILELARRERWGRVLLVTNQYHVARVGLLADLSGLPADVVAAEAIVDQAMADPQVHERLCAHERDEAAQSAIRQERAYMNVIELLRG